MMAITTLVLLHNDAVDIRRDLFEHGALVSVLVPYVLFCTLFVVIEESVVPEMIV